MRGTCAAFTWLTVWSQLLKWTTECVFGLPTPTGSCLLPPGGWELCSAARLLNYPERTPAVLKPVTLRGTQWKDNANTTWNVKWWETAEGRFQAGEKGGEVDSNYMLWISQVQRLEIDYRVIPCRWLQNQLDQSDCCLTDAECLWRGLKGGTISHVRSWVSRNDSGV